MPFILKTTQYLQTAGRILSNVVFSSPANLAPSFTSGASFSVEQNDQYAHTLTATDPNNDTLTYSIVSGPAWVSLTVDRLTAFPGVGVSAQDYQVTVRVSDSELSSDQVITITVTELPVVQFVAPIKREISWDEGITPTMVIGDVFDHKITLRAGNPRSDFDISSAQSIKIAVVSNDHSEVYTDTLSLIVNDSGSDLDNGLVRLDLPSSFTEQIRGRIRRETLAILEVEVMLRDRRYTWFTPVRIVEGFIN